MLNKNFDNIFKSKLEEHTSTPRSDLWQNIESQLPNPSPTSYWSFSKVITTCVTTGLIGAGAFIFFTRSNTDNNLNIDSKKSVQKNTTEETYTETPQEEIIETKIENKTITTSSSINSAQNSKLNTPPKNDGFSIKDIFTPKNESNISLKNNKIDKTHTTPNTKPKVEKTYEAGETVVLQFEFQNVSGVSTKKVESWIEFPDWIDVSSVETVSYSPGIDVKTTIKAKYNTVIWLAHGNFSGEITSLSSKGMIEYRFKLKEAKTQSEINTIKPEIK